MERASFRPESEAERSARWEKGKEMVINIASTVLFRGVGVAGAAAVLFLKQGE